MLDASAEQLIATLWRKAGRESARIHVLAICYLTLHDIEGAGAGAVPLS